MERDRDQAAGREMARLHPLSLCRTRAGKDPSRARLPPPAHDRGETARPCPFESDRVGFSASPCVEGRAGEMAEREPLLVLFGRRRKRRPTTCDVKSLSRAPGTMCKKISRLDPWTRQRTSCPTHPVARLVEGRSSAHHPDNTKRSMERNNGQGLPSGLDREREHAPPLACLRGPVRDDDTARLTFAGT